MIDLEFLFDLTRQAGSAILEVYRTDFSIERKEDRSPVTLADMRSHDIISRALEARYPDIPVLSEEGKSIPYDDRKAWKRFWLVDPLDGTREFVKRNDEFTVNIALVEGNLPVLGLIYVPVMDLLYVGDTRKGCSEITGGARRDLRMADIGQGRPVRVVRSRSHSSPGLDSILGLLPAYEDVSKGSALKFCALASGSADFYPRLGPTWEWDTAAGQAIVSSAGGVVVNALGKPLSYNKEVLLNGAFFGAPSLEWLERTGVLEQARPLEG